MGAGRSVRKVSQKLDKSRTLIGRWSTNYNWVERAKAYDKEMERQALIEEAKERKSMRKRHATTAMAFQGKVVERLNSFNAEELTASELIRWYEIATKIERTARGEPAEIQELKHGGEVSQKHEHSFADQLEEYAELLERAAEEDDGEDEE